MRAARRSIRLLGPVALAAWAACSPAAPAAGATSAVPGPATPAAGLEMTPARVEVDLDSRRVDQQLTIFNHDAVAHPVSVGLTGLGHDLEGTPQFPDSGGALVLTATRLSIPGNGSATVSVRGSVPAGSAGEYAGVVASLIDGADSGAAVVVRTRVASMILLRAPRPWHESLAVEAVDVVGGKVRAVVRNTGDVHQRPSGTVRVLRAGKVLGTATLRPEVVLPGYARRLVGEWPLAGSPPGDVTLMTDIGGSVKRTHLSIPAGAVPSRSGGPVRAGSRAAPADDRNVPVWLLWFVLTFLLALAALWWLVKRRRNRGRSAAREPRTGIDGQAVDVQLEVKV